MGGPSGPGSTHSHMTITRARQLAQPCVEGPGSVHSSVCAGPRELGESGKVLPRHQDAQADKWWREESAKSRMPCMCLSESLSWGEGWAGTE